MSRSCPSCGSAVAAGVTTCPICGEQLAETESGMMVVTETGAAPVETAPVVTAPVERTPASEAPKTEPASAARAVEAKEIICPACSATNLPGAAFCSSCGTRLAVAPKKAGGKGSRGETPAATATAPKGSHLRDYIIALVASIVIAGVMLLIFTPEEHFGPPQAEQPAATGEGMPPGHPPADQPPVATPEQQQEMATLEKQIAEHPDDVDAKRKLADLYYNLERHAEAVPLYRDYLAKHPENADARTDMAYSIANNGGIDSAIVELRRVVGEDSKHQNATYNLAMMYAAKRDRDSTLYWLEQVVAIDSTTQPGRQAAQILAEVKGAHPSMGDSAMKRQ